MGDTNISGPMYEMDSHQKLLIKIACQKNYRYQIEAVNLIGYPQSPKVSINPWQQIERISPNSSLYCCSFYKSSNFVSCQIFTIVPFNTQCSQLKPNHEIDNLDIFNLPLTSNSIAKMLCPKKMAAVPREASSIIV